MVFGALLSLGALFFSIPAALAQTPAPVQPLRAVTDDETAARGRNAGSVDGIVTAVDYQRLILTIQSAARGKIDVVVLPSTNITGHGEGFHTIADVARGSHVEVFLSQRAGLYVAQIIHLK
jgi:hypothetical protein